MKGVADLVGARRRLGAAPRKASKCAAWPMTNRDRGTISSPSILHAGGVVKGRAKMRALLTGVGTRGDVQPVAALAVELRRRGHDARLCVPPNFIDWVGGLGFTATPIGIAMRQPSGGPSAPPTPEQMREMARHLVTD